MQESKKQRFVRVAEKRTNHIIDQIDKLKNLDNSQVYEYSNDQINTICDSLMEQIETTRNYLLGKETKRFKL